MNEQCTKCHFKLASSAIREEIIRFDNKEEAVFVLKLIMNNDFTAYSC